MKKHLLKKRQALLLVIFISHQIFAQDKTSTGKVTNAEDGVALVGANVVIKGTTRGTTADATGSYKLSIPNNVVVVFSYIGYLRKELKVVGSTELDVSLDSDENTLSDVVVTALGIKQERKTLGYSIQELKGSDIADT